MQDWFSILKSGNVIHYSRISRYRKIFDTIKHTLIIKTLHKLEMK